MVLLSRDFHNNFLAGKSDHLVPLIITPETEDFVLARACPSKCGVTEITFSVSEICFGGIGQHEYCNIKNQTII